MCCTSHNGSDTAAGSDTTTGSTSRPRQPQPPAPTTATQPTTAASGEPIYFFAPVELSGGGATTGINWRDGMIIAIEDINAAGGILGRPVEVEFADTQSDPATSKAVIAKGLEEQALCDHGTACLGFDSSSI